MNILRIILVFFICFLLITITLQNLEKVEKVKVFFDEFHNISLASIILFAYLFGLLTVGIFAIIGEIKLRSEIRKLKKEKDALLAELNDLRNYFLVEKGEE